MLSDAALRAPNEIRHDVGVQQIAHQSPAGSGLGSGIGGKSSSRGASAASRDNRDFGWQGSMISLSPSLRMIASCPGSSKSRGMRTARFRPFLKAHMSFNRHSLL